MFINKLIHHTWKRVPLLLLLLGYLLLSLFTYRSYGLTNDEAEDYFLGKLLYIKIMADDPVIERSFLINDGKSETLIRYDRIYPALLYSLNETEDYEQYHFLNLLFASVILIASYEMLLKHSANKWQALAAPCLILLTPRFFGHIAANPKDVPFAISYLTSLWLIYKTKKQSSPSSLLLLGLSFGLTQSLRTIGYSIYPVYILYLFWVEKISFQLNKVLNFLAQIGVIFGLGFLLHLLTQPFLAADPLTNFKYLLNTGANFPWDGEILFNSKILMASQLPWFYLPSWILITTPVAILLLAGFSLTKNIRSSKLARLIWLALIINLLIFFWIKPTIYDGLRHMLFLLPMVAVLASMGLVKLIKQKRKLLVGSLVVWLMIVALIQIRLFPYQYVYFNELVGGLPGAAGKFELDYWGASYREAVSWLNDHTDPNQVANVYICGHATQLQSYAQAHLQLTTDIDQTQYIICQHRGNNRVLLNQFSTKLYATQRLGVQLIEVKSR